MVGINSVELDGLRYFISVASAGSFVAGARRAHGSPPAVSKAVKKLEVYRTRAIAIEADVGREADCLMLVEQTASRLGRIDILVNNAGMAIRKPPQDYSTAEWRQVLDVNLSSAFYVTHAALGLLRQQPPAHVVNFTD